VGSPALASTLRQGQGLTEDAEFDKAYRQLHDDPELVPAERISSDPVVALVADSGLPKHSRAGITKTTSGAT